MKLKVLLKLFTILLLGIPAVTFANTGTSQNCNKLASLTGTMQNMIGCGKATTFGHTTTGKKDQSVDDGNTFCNTTKEKSKYTYRNDRTNKQNLDAKFAALRMSDLVKLIGAKVASTGKFRYQNALAPHRSKFCGRWLNVKDLSTGKQIKVQLMDVMSNNNKVIDLTGGAMKELKDDKKEEYTLRNVQVTWAN